MALETLERRVARLPEPRRSEAEEAITTVGSALIRDPGALKDAAWLAHERPDGPQTSTRAGQEARNLRRVFMLWRGAAEESLTAEDLGVSRQQLKHLRDAGKLVALQLPLRRVFVYPAWQFDPHTCAAFASIPRIAAAAKEANLTPLGLHQLMVSPAGENGLAPAELLAAGEHEYVVGLVGAANAHGS